MSLTKGKFDSCLREFVGHLGGGCWPVILCQQGNSHEKIILNPWQVRALLDMGLLDHMVVKH